MGGTFEAGTRELNGCKFENWSTIYTCGSLESHINSHSLNFLSFKKETMIIFLYREALKFSTRSI